MTRCDWITAHLLDASKYTAAVEQRPESLRFERRLCRRNQFWGWLGGGRRPAVEQPAQVRASLERPAGRVRRGYDALGAEPPQNLSGQDRVRLVEQRRDRLDLVHHPGDLLDRHRGLRGEKP